MKRRILTLLIILLTMTVGLNFVSAENETVLMTSEAEENELKIKSEEERTGDIVGASEDGHFNISFDDGYNGYCINYGDHEATEGHEFIVKDTTEAINSESGESVGNELKTFFVEYYHTAMENIYKTQHVIWHFTDNFDSWRYEASLIEDIKQTSSQTTIPDHGAVKKIDNDTLAIFDFEVLKSTNPGHQNFFAYKITYRNISEIIQNESVENTTNTTNDTLKNESDTPEENETYAQTPIENVTHNEASENINSQKAIDAKSEDTNMNENESKEESKVLKSSLKKHATGYNYIAALIILIFGTLLIIKYSRD